MSPTLPEPPLGAALPLLPLDDGVLVLAVEVLGAGVLDGVLLVLGALEGAGLDDGVDGLALGVDADGVVILNLLVVY
jgi:hypothetical protein